MNSAVEFSRVSRHYGGVRAVDDVSLVVNDGEFFSMLGPSGSGKTTCLRLIAGFEQPGAGRVVLHGRDATGLPPYQRDVNTVFQDYALFPHMNIRDNVAYGLLVSGADKRTRHRQAEEALELVALGGYGARRPGQLSGGQRQRVALARALVRRPRILLLDEPLGALDLKLREQMQIELKTLQRKLGVTFIYVTHDQGEALSMSDRVAVFNKGRIEQVDTPRNLYTRPATPFVADFVGTSNVIVDPALLQRVGATQPFAIRPEHIRFSGAAPASTDDVQLPGTLIDIQYYGATSRFEVRSDAGQRLAVTVANQDDAATALPAVGDAVTLAWARRAMVALEPRG
ncbi:MULTISPECIES: ABC transporter ATP-binding protein [unclassified Burkholderia]|uniref:ABC transporter ATP-binding protein n=1 Tax=unclassified Burkholderia TaxID=2613784 RepID=UPI00075CBB3F|nr:MULTISPECIES: ABC transporter ATP-binding protein [unclassified Burkholderia]KVN12681.1 polyamine ABC transporter ATP-binding protein [Burkholderia sp. MSMB1552]KWZ49473.1 polyamine ABC transporter ATP-binding protein [Burkholderia sp. MSMB1588]